MSRGTKPKRVRTTRGTAGGYAGAFFSLALVLSSCNAGGPRPEAANQVVVMIDGSGSYRSRQDDALARTLSLLDGLAERTLHRWERGNDSITLVSLDAMPAVLWEGTLKDLKTVDRAAWSARFRARTDYAACTDVAAAFEVAADRLVGDPSYVSKYLFVFSDLIDEPPTTSIRRCRRPSAGPPERFPWDSLLDVSVSTFWMPPEQKLVWQRAVSEHDLEKSFALYTTSESGAVEILPPPPARVTQTEEDRQTVRDGLGRAAHWTLAVAGIVLAAIAVVAAVVLVLVVIVSRRRRRSRGYGVGGARLRPMSRRASASRAAESGIHPRVNRRQPAWPSGLPRSPGGPARPS